MVDPHTIATFAFAQLRRDPAFGPRFPWLHNTIVCVESDLAEDVLSGQMVHYFGETGGTIACYFPDDQRFLFIQAGVPETGTGEMPPPKRPGVREMRDSRENPLTIGELVNAIYKQRQGDWSHLPRWNAQTGFADPQQPLFGEVSTIEVEKQLALT